MYALDFSLTLKKHSIKFGMTGCYTKLNLIYWTLLPSNTILPFKQDELCPNWKLSVLGPLLYILFTRDFPTSPQSTLEYFADFFDELCKASTTQLATLHIQHLTHASVNWSVPNKSTVVRFANLRNCLHTDQVHINVTGVQVATTSLVKYLGL